MSKVHFIFSTLPNAQEYTSHVVRDDKSVIPVRSVIIKGGAGVADKRYETAPGVMTEVSDEDLEFLKANVVFKRHVERGFIQVHDKAVEVEVAAADMDRNSGDRPLVDADFEAQGVKPPTHANKNVNNGRK